MRTRIIIEKDGRRWEVTSDYAVFIEADGRVDILTKHTTVTMMAKELPPVVRTDNSEVIANLEAENAKLREALKPVLEVNSDFRIYAAILRHETDKLFALQDAVRKAKEIMKGEKK